MNNEIKTGTIVKITLCCMLIPIFILAVVCISNYNSMVTMRNNVRKIESDIEAALQHRWELIPDLVNTVKAYTKHEEKVYSEISNARAMLKNALDNKDLETANKANETLTAAVDKLKLFINENYPELKSEELYVSLMDQIEGTANRVLTARRYYNDAAFDYNTTIEQFPKNIFASIFGFEKAKEFKADEEAHKSHVVDFGDDWHLGQEEKNGKLISKNIIKVS